MKEKVLRRAFQGDTLRVLLTVKKHYSIDPMYIVYVVGPEGQVFKEYAYSTLANAKTQYDSKVYCYDLSEERQCEKVKKDSESGRQGIGTRLLQKLKKSLKI